MSEEVPNVSGANVEAAAPVDEQYRDEHVDQQVEKQVEKQVPLAALESERSQRQHLQDELKMIKEHLSLMQARPTQPQPQEPSLSDDDVMTYGEFKKMATKFQNEVKMSLEEMQVTKKYSDYEEVVKKYLPEVVQKNPKFKSYLEKTQDFEFAYDIAKSSDSYRKDHHKVQQHADAQRLMANAERPGSLSSVGGTTPISMAKRYKDMSDGDFRKEMAKNMGYV